MKALSSLLAIFVALFSLNALALNDDQELEFTGAVNEGDIKTVKKYVEVLLIPVNANEDPTIVSLNAELAKGLLVDVCPFAPTPTNSDNNLLSPIVAIYPLGSFILAIPPKLSVVGLTLIVAPKEICILEILAVTIGNFVVPLGNVTNLWIIILFPSGNASKTGIFSIASPAY